MTFKIKISQFLTKAKPNNGNETKSDIFSWDIFKSNIFHWPQNIKYFNDFYHDIFQFYCKCEHKQIKWNEIKQDMCKCDSIFPYLQRHTLFKWLMKFNFLIRLISKMNDNSSEGKIFFVYFHSVNVRENCTHQAEKNSRPGAQITTILRLSWKYFNCIIIKTF